MKAHVRELRAFVNIFPILEALTLSAQVSASLGPCLRTGLALVVSPASTYRAATESAREKSFDGAGALPVPIFRVAGLFSGVDAGCVWKIID